MRIDAATPPPISPEARAGLDDYIGPGHREINQGLRGEVPVTPELQRQRRCGVRRAVRAAPAPGVVYRGTELTEEQLARYQPGQTVTEDAFTSSTRDPSRTLRGNVEFTIDSVDGKDVAPFAPARFAPQEEVLFDHGTRFEVLSRTMNSADRKGRDRTQGGAWMSDDEYADVDDPRLSEEGRRSLARIRQAKAEAKAAGEWKTRGPFAEDDDKFAGPFGVDAEGNVLVHDTPEEAQAARAERERTRRTSAGDDEPGDEPPEAG